MMQAHISFAISSIFPSSIVNRERLHDNTRGREIDRQVRLYVQGL